MTPLQFTIQCEPFCVKKSTLRQVTSESVEYFVYKKSAELGSLSDTLSLTILGSLGTRVTLFFAKAFGLTV